MSDFAQIKERLEKATGPSRPIEEALKLAIAAHMFAAGASKEDVVATVGGDFYADPPLWTSSVDAALALVERLLPGWTWRVEKWTECYDAKLWGLADAPGIGAGHGPTAPLAILAALLTALPHTGDENV